MTMFIEENIVYLIFAFFLVLSFRYLPRKIDTESFQNLVEFKAIKKKAKVKKESRLRNSKSFKTREASLKNYIDKNNSTLTVEDVYTENFKIVTVSLFIFVFIFILSKNVLISLIPFGIAIAACFRHDYLLKNAYEDRATMVTHELPNFIMNVNMAMGAGMDINPAMEVAARTVNSKVQNEFVRLFTEARLNPDKLEKVYRDLSERIDTEEISIFSNVVLTGLKNGTSMEKIFESEAKRLKATTVVFARMKCDKAENNSTLLSTALILFPGIIVIIAPFILNS